MLYTVYADIRNITEKFGRKTFDANASYDEGVIPISSFIFWVRVRNKEDKTLSIITRLTDNRKEIQNLELALLQSSFNET